MNWIPVGSSNIKEVAYQEGVGDIKNILSVRFHKSGVYHYIDVPRELYEEMLRSDSVGRFFAERIKNVFDYWKASPDEDFKR